MKVLMMCSIGALLMVVTYLIVQGMRCSIATRKKLKLLYDYNAKYIHFLHAKDDKLASYADVEKALYRFPNCTHISFETGGHLMVGHEEEVKKAVMEFVKL